MVGFLMVTNSDGYSSLIEYLSENLSVFELSKDLDDQPMTINTFIRFQMVEQMTLIFEQNKSLIQQEKIYIFEEFDRVVNDLSEVLGHNMNNKISKSQHEFITEFAGLLKNLFDAQLSPV